MIDIQFFSDRRNRYVLALETTLLLGLIAVLFTACASTGIPQVDMSQVDDPVKQQMLQNRKIPKGEVIHSGPSILSVSNPIKPTSLIIFSRQGQTGSFFVDQGEIASFNVSDGCYEMSFIYSNEPDALYQGDDVCVHSQKCTITLKEVTHGNYRIRRIQ